MPSYLDYNDIFCKEIVQQSKGIIFSFDSSFKVVGTLLEKSTYSYESCYRVITFSITRFGISKTIIEYLIIKSITI